MGEKCDNCGAPAANNVQKVWIRWKYDFKKNKYSRKYESLFCIEEPNGEDNLHVCDCCFKLWKDGKI